MMRRGRLSGVTMMAGLKKLARDRSAAAAMELALLLPALMAMMFSVIQLGFAGFTQSAMLSGARDGARQVAFGVAGTVAATSVRAQLPPWVRSGATIVVTENAGGMARVRITVPGAAASLMPLLPMPTSISADITMPRVADR
jgi:hypothetical protein